MNNERQNRIDAYLRGEMMAEDRKRFELEMKHDSALGEEVELTRRIQKTLAHRQEKLEKMAIWDREIKRSSVSPRRKVQRWFYVALVAAACLLGVYVVFPTEGNIHAYDASFFQSEMAYRGGGEIAAINGLIVERDFQRAWMVIDSLEDICRQDLKPVVDDQCSEEEIYNRRVAEEMLYQLCWQRIHWYLAQNKVDEAVALLRTFRLQKGEYQSKAAELWGLLGEK